MSLPGLWLARLPGAAPAGWEEHLGPEEVQRGAAMQAPQRKLQFIASRLLLRQALAQCTGAAPQSFRISAEPGAKPLILEGGPGLHFSLAHSGQACAVLVDTGPCGVDMEAQKPGRDFAALARHHFSPPELAFFEAAPGPESFYQCWCAHEARFKSGIPGAWLASSSWEGYALAICLGSEPLELESRPGLTNAWERLTF